MIFGSIRWQIQRNDLLQAIKRACQEIKGNTNMSFKSAQRQYDRVLPPESRKQTCPRCNGHRVDLTYTACCGTNFLPDSDICCDCGEPAKPGPCERCDGEGVIQI